MQLIQPLEVCTWKMCLSAAHPRVIALTFKTRLTPASVCALRANAVVPALTARAALCGAVSQEGRYSGTA